MYNGMSGAQVWGLCLLIRLSHLSLLIINKWHDQRASSIFPIGIVLS